MARTHRLSLAGIINRGLSPFGVQLLSNATLAHLKALEAKVLAGTASRAAEPPGMVDPQAVTQRLDRVEEALRGSIRYAMKAHWGTIDLLEAAMGGTVPLHCALCGQPGDGAPFEPLVSACQFLGGRLLRHKCPNCEVVFGPQKMLRLDQEMVDLEYRNLYQIYSEGDSAESTIRTFHLLRPRRDGTYLDFGCGGAWSAAITKLRSEGWNIWGFEPSAPIASDHVFGTWEEIEQRNFDGILSHNVLEHLFDPIGTTKRLAARLKPGGRLIHATPCFEYRYDFSHLHVFFFTGRSPEVLAANAGMRIQGWERQDEYIACILEKNSLPSASTGLVAQSLAASLPSISP